MIMSARFLCFTALAIILSSSGFGDVGVFNTRFSATDSQPPATIEYRLNCAATVTIDIVNESNQVVRSLGPYSESSGLHSRTWDGTGASAGAHTYRARIRADAAAAGAPGTLQTIFEKTGSATQYGIAIDKCPSSPGYGAIYRSEVCAGGRIWAYYADGSPKLGFGGSQSSNCLSLGLGGTTADSPWGIGVDSQGNIYAARKSALGQQTAIKVFNYQGNLLNQVSASESQGNFWADGIVGPQGNEVYVTVGGLVRTRTMPNPAWNTVMGPAVSTRDVKQLCFETNAAACYVATRSKTGDSGNQGVARYARQPGGEWTADAGFDSHLDDLSNGYGTPAVYAIGAACDGRDPDGAGPYSASVLWVSLDCSNDAFGGNIVRIRLPSGTPEFYPGPGPRGRILAADGVGNVAVEYGTAPTLWSVFRLCAAGGESSSDTSTTNEIALLGTAAAEELHTIAEVKGRPTGTLVELVSAKVVSAVFADAFYIQEDDGSCALRVEGAASPSLGAAVKVRGQLQTVAGERALVSAEIVP